MPSVFGSTTASTTSGTTWYTASTFRVHSVPNDPDRHLGPQGMWRPDAYRRCGSRGHFAYNYTDTTPLGWKFWAYERPRDIPFLRRGFRELSGHVASMVRATTSGDALNAFREARGVVHDRLLAIPRHDHVFEMLLEKFPNGKFGRISQCSECEEWLYKRDLTAIGELVVCEGCLDEYYTWLEDEDEYVHNRYVIRVYTEDGDWFNASEGRAEDEFFYSQALERWQDYEPDPDEEARVLQRRLRLGEQIISYHSSRRYLQHHRCASPGPYMGFELEVEVDKNLNHKEKAKAMMTLMNECPSPTQFDRPAFYWLAESDSTIGYGFELVSCWTDLATHEAYLKRFDTPEGQEATKLLRSHDTSTCGLHVHICKEGMTQLHLGKLAVFMNSDEMRPFLKLLYRRYGVRYSMIAKKKLNRSALITDRYEVVNFTNPKTVEFRGARGTLRWQSIMAVLEFTRAAWQFTKVASAQNMGEPQFLKWCMESAHLADTRYLRKYLSGKAKKFEWLVRTPEEVLDI